MNEQQDFNSALKALKPLLERKSPLFQCFRQAAIECNNKIDWNINEPNPELPYVKYDMPAYIGDAVAIYERRQEPHSNHPALLFDGSSQHIVGLRRAIQRVQEIFSDQNSEQHKAAETLSVALESTVAAARSLQSMAKKENGRIHIIGYRGGMVAREFGEYIKDEYGFEIFHGSAVIEMGIEHLKHLQELNGLANYQPQEERTIPLDFCIIFKNGSAHTFNFRSDAKDGREDLYGHQVIEKLLAVVESVGHGSGKSDGLDAEIEKKLSALILELEKSRPPLVESKSHLRIGGKSHSRIAAIPANHLPD